MTAETKYATGGNEPAKAGKRAGAPRDGCWAAYNPNEAGAAPIIRAIFPTELAALKYAVANGLKTHRVRYGVDLRDQISGDAS
jgi:hypothetical protein